MSLRVASLISMLVVAIFMCAPTLAHAQSYPTKPIHFVVPFPAGSATDSVGRILAQAMSEALHQPITVENKAGANGILGAESVKSSLADGYTLLVTTSTTQAANVHLYKKLPYDPIKDFTPIGKIGETGFILMVAKDFPARNLQEFISYVRAHPGEITYGQGSSGSWVSAALLAEMTGLKIVNVPYKGVPPALTDLMSGQIHFVFADVGNATAQIAGGRLRGLGITTHLSSSKAPGIAPIGQTVKNYSLEAWLGLVAPANLPPEIQKKLSTTLLTVLKSPQVQDKMRQAGIEIDTEDASTFGKTLQSEITKWGQWVKMAGITPN
jgi:tripartite-type tricarboxylate transporter receptor subunit TctC